MGSDGSLWRPQAASRALDEAFAIENYCDPADLNNLDEVLYIEYNNTIHSVGGATAYRFLKWLDREEIKPTPEKYKGSWKAAQVEAKVWNNGDVIAGR